MAACTEDNDGEKEAINKGVCIVLLDKDSTDLLDPDNPNGYKFSEMGLYEDLDLKQKRLAGWQLVAEMNCFNNSDIKLYYGIAFHAPMDYKIKRDGETIWYATSYLKLNQTTVDTVYTEVTETAHSLKLRNVLYNGVDITTNYFVVIK